MNKTTNIILIAILVVSFVGLVGILQKGAGGSLSLGSAEYNLLPEEITNTTVSVPASVLTSATGNQVLDYNSGRKYARIQNTGSYLVTLQLDNATSTLTLGKGIVLATSGAESVYVIGVDNLYQGRVLGLSVTATGTLSIIEK